ncbi:DinB family protein [Pedobacter sp. UYP30]|uniref:DinB family protein n=1 Tax=Pedobacter sp. UYP30 TaxID=1756400 RepID=UPI0033984B32
MFLDATLTVSAQSTDSLQVQLARKWEHSKVYALKLAALMPEADYGFKASPEEMSFQEQLLHIADNINMLSSSYLFCDAPTARDPKTKLSKTEVLKILADAYDCGLKANTNVATSLLDEKVKFFAGPMTRRQILILMHDHQTHHLGQLIVYLRLKGIKPPAYIGW